ncbi:MAG: PDZ domain-containing protein [Candidatus Eisenbacteria bacterium]|nr:PDZ domain-containing protein [Candidatus Eisenbacteria bacterium]
MRGRAWATAVCIGLCLAAVQTPVGAEDVDAGPAKQGWLGVSITDITDEVRGKHSVPPDVTGVLVLEVHDGSPAEKAGIKEGDAITTAAGRAIADVAAMVDVVRGTAPGSDIAIVVLRDGKPLTLNTTVAEREKARIAVLGGLDGLQALKALKEIDLDLPWVDVGLSGAAGRGRLGVYIDDLSEGLAEHFAVPGGKGVLVEDVVKGGPAEKAGIRPGDVILKIGDTPVGSTAELRDAIGSIGAGQETKVVVWRDRKKITLAATIEESEHARAVRAYVRAAGDGEKVRQIRIIETERAELKEAVEELKDEIRELKDEIRRLKKQIDSE